jgi:hypothetical protein
MGVAEVAAFINHLAVNRNVAASTQSQALNALVFLYDHVLERPLGQITGLRRVQHRQRVPVVLTVGEVQAVLSRMQGTTKLMAQVLYGAGLRVRECVTLRIKDLDLKARTITVRAGKGAKDRTTIMAESLVEPLQSHLLRVARLHKDDRLSGAGFAPLPNALDRKYRTASGSRKAYGNRSPSLSAFAVAAICVATNTQPKPMERGLCLHSTDKPGHSLATAAPQRVKWNRRSRSREEKLLPCLRPACAQHEPHRRDGAPTLSFALANI